MFSTNYVVGGRLDPPFMPTKTSPYIKGDIMEFVQGSEQTQSKSFVVMEDMEFLSVAVATSRYYPTDNWDLKVNDQIICQSIYTKDLPEGMFFIATIQLTVGDEIVFTFKNLENVPKFVWFNYQFLK